MTSLDSPDTGAGTPPIPPFALREAIIDAVRGSDPIAALKAFGAYDAWWWSAARSRPARDPAVHVHDYGAARIPCSNPECRPATDPVEPRHALARIAAWSSHHKDEARTQLRRTMALIHDEAMRAVPGALDAAASPAPPSPMDRRSGPMRDHERIDKVCAALAELWHEVPDWRLGQLIANVNPRRSGDGFYVEDNEWLAALKAERAALPVHREEPTDG